MTGSTAVTAARTARRLAALSVWCLVPFVAAKAQSDSLRAAVERAVVIADWPAIDRAAVRLRTQSVSPAGRTNAWLHYDLAYVLHRRVSGFINERRTTEAKAMVEEALRAAARADSLGAGATARALQGALAGQMAAVGGGLAPMRFGPRALSLLEDALEEAPDDPRVALLNGMTRFNAPRAFGGGPAKAEAELRRALRLFETDRSAAPRPTWGKVDAHIWLAQALHAQGKDAEARAEYERALALAPGHRWIVEQLLPALERGR